MMLSKLETVKGHTIATPRLTGYGVWLLVKYIGLPLIALLGLLDGLLYLAFTYGLEQCYGVWCWF